MLSLEEADHTVQEFAASFAAGVGLYRSRRFREANETFVRLIERYPDDTPTQLYIGRCRELIAHPPPDGWDPAVDHGK
ncbi:MAG: hypothetical protein HQK87_09515 [Nitrospinae bacterium]|nr:hypothetical protein [Nitrospinota bacterium]